MGFFDISKRSVVDREILTLTVPFGMFQEMETSVEGGFLEMHDWIKLQERQQFNRSLREKGYRIK